MQIVGHHPEAQVRVVELDAPVPILEWRLREWSDDFSLPTVVRNAFTPPEIHAEAFLPGDHPLDACLGRVGEFHDANGRHPWSALWAQMESGGDCYGSFGAATNNWTPETVAAVRRWKERLLPKDVFPWDDFVGHVIFGAADARKVTTTWHDAIDANLLFQLHGRKEWYSIETLPPGYSLSSVVQTANAVFKDGAPEPPAAGSDDKSLQPLFEYAAHVTLGPGDLLINTPFSWHAIEIEEFNVSLSLRGDKADVVAWLALRYFGGRLDHPMLNSFANFFAASPYPADGDAPPMRLRSALKQAVRTRLGMLRQQVRARLLGEPPFNPTFHTYGNFSGAHRMRMRYFQDRLDRYLGEEPHEVVSADPAAPRSDPAAPRSDPEAPR